MRSRRLLAILAGGIVAFVWSSISWMLLPWHQSTMSGFDQQDTMAAAVKAAATEPGIYVYPEWSDDQEDMQKRFKEGPYVFASIVPGGVGDGMGKMMLFGFISNLIGAALLLILLLTVPDEGWKARALVATIAAAFVALVPAMANWNWWNFPMGFTVVGILDSLIAWTLAGVVMAKLVAGRTTAD